MQNKAEAKGFRFYVFFLVAVLLGYHSFWAASQATDRPRSP